MDSNTNLISNAETLCAQGELCLLKKDLFGFEINVLGQHFNRTLDSLFEQMQEARQQCVGRELILNELEIGHQIQTSILPKELPTGILYPISEFYWMITTESRSAVSILIQPTNIWKHSTTGKKPAKKYS